MRLRQTYQPKQQPQEQQPTHRMRLHHSYGRQPIITQAIKPIDQHTNFRLFLYNTKQALEYKQASQFTINDPMLKVQPHYQFNPQQADTSNTIKFQAYLDGELTPQEYLLLQNYSRLYSIAKSERTRIVDDDDDDDDQVVQQKESQLKKLKERLVHRCKYENRIKMQQQQQQCKHQVEQQSIDPIQNLANQLKKAILRKQLNISENVNKLEHKSFQSIKLINSLHQVQQQFQDKSQNKDIMCSYYHKPYYQFNNKSINKTKSIKIIKHSNQSAKVDMDEAEESNIQIISEMDQQFRKILQKSKSAQELPISKPQNRHIHFANQVTTNSTRTDSKICKKVVTEQHEERENSANSSLQSIFEKRVSSMYSKSILLQKSIKLNEQSSLTKRIRNIQSVYQLNNDMIRTSSQRLQYQQN